MTRRPPPQPLFLPGPPPAGGQRWAVLHEPATAPRASLLYLPPFAEELNKSRRMAALGARALADAGCRVLQLDPLGCGDSSGDFADASWAQWLADAESAAQWLRGREGADALPLWVWGLRAGCLLAAELLPRLGGACHALFWQPPGAGKPLLQQFLRLKMAAMLADAGGDGGAPARGVTEALRAQLAAGETVELAGYRLAASVAQGLDAATLQAPPAAAGARLAWLEVTPREPAELLPASAAPLQRWRDAGWAVQAQAVGGPAFWQAVEIEEAPALVQASVAAVCGMASDPAAAAPPAPGAATQGVGA